MYIFVMFSFFLSFFGQGLGQNKTKQNKTKKKKKKKKKKKEKSLSISPQLPSSLEAIQDWCCPIQSNFCSNKLLKFLICHSLSFNRVHAIKLKLPEKKYVHT